MYHFLCHKIKTDIMSAKWLCYTVENRKKIIILHLVFSEEVMFLNILIQKRLTHIQLV